MFINTNRILLLIAVFASPTFTSCKTRKNDQSSEKALTNLRTKEPPVDLTRYEATNEELAMVKNEFPVVYNWAEKYVKLKKMPGKIRIEEAAALRLYTGSIYTHLNNSLRAKDPSSLPMYANTIKAASSGLNHLPPESCTAVRGVDNLSAVAIDTLKKKKRYKEAGFTSTTYEGEGFRGFIQFTIKSDSCRKIDWLSIHEDEKEALFPPGSEFIVDKAEFIEKTVSNEKVMTGVIELTHTMDADPAGEPPTISTEPDPGSEKFQKSEILNQTFTSHKNPTLSITLHSDNFLMVEKGNAMSAGYWSLFGDIVTLTPNNNQVFGLPIGGTVQLKGVHSKKFGWIDPKDPNNVLDIFTATSNDSNP